MKISSTRESMRRAKDSLEKISTAMFSSEFETNEEKVEALLQISANLRQISELSRKCAAEARQESEILRQRSRMMFSKEEKENVNLPVAAD